MEQQSVRIELYEDEKGESDLLLQMSPKDKARFVKKNEDLEKLPFYNFRQSKDVSPIRGLNCFYELRYRFSSPPYRAIAFIHKSLLVILLVFKGSGSNGKLEKNLPKAINRSKKWKSRF